MIVLRLLSLLAGFLVLILPAIVLADSGTAGLPGMKVVAGLAAMTVVSASFVYIAFAGERMRRHARERALGAVLLAVPIAGSLFLLATRKEPGILWTGGILLVFCLVLFMGFVVSPRESRQRPMRRRERQEAKRLKLQG